MMPAELEDPATPVPAQTRRLRFEVDPGAEELPDWWPGDEDPLVYLTFGSVAAGAHLPYYPALYRAAIDALAPLAIRILLTVGDAERDRGARGGGLERPRGDLGPARRRRATRRCDRLPRRQGHARRARPRGAARRSPSSATTSGRTVQLLPAPAPGSRSPTTPASARSSTCRDPRRSMSSPGGPPRSWRTRPIDEKPVASPLPCAPSRRSTSRCGSSRRSPAVADRRLSLSAGPRRNCPTKARCRNGRVTGVSSPATPLAGIAQATVSPGGWRSAQFMGMRHWPLAAAIARPPGPPSGVHFLPWCAMATVVPRGHPRAGSVEQGIAGEQAH